MLKRITYLEKLPELTTEQFSDHWSTTHAGIAKDLPGLACYLQNHVEEHLADVNAGDAYRVDGIVELWFDEADVVHAASDSPVGDRLIEDEKRFLAGLTGGPVLGGAPHPPWPFKVWVLGLSAEGADPRFAGSWLSDAAQQFPDAIGSEANRLDSNPQLLRREALRSEPKIPDVALTLGFASWELANVAAQNLTAQSERLTAAMENIHVYVAAERQIVPGSGQSAER
ncbi:EthD domain-containing protein [Brevibacterium atlanticum]|uniref:EthD domain-containing protein n=1 Tax=Brevibacterium atlanticum TaxID=2697563 RepID=UPI001420FE9A|nr:EthD domain-containing protein [Brevibacterium atlanticum]